jgi:phosphoesterase, MJ0936 family
MKILVLSDTHIPSFSSSSATDPSQSIDVFSVFTEILRDKIQTADMIIHAGDFESEEAYRRFEKTGKLKAVYGDNDEKSIRQILPDKLIFEQNGLKFGVIHEAGVSLNDNTARWYLLEEMGVDILIYGHIHTPSVDEYNHKFLICPGSPTKARMSEPAVIEIILDDTQPRTVSKIQIIPVGNAACGYLKFQETLAEKERK